VKKQTELLASADVARLAGVTTDCVRWWVRSGKLRAAQVLPNGMRLFQKSDVVRWIAVRQRHTRASDTDLLSGDAA
jgi:DNA-binding transcriptional MerR regulator